MKPTVSVHRPRQYGCRPAGDGDASALSGSEGFRAGPDRFDPLSITLDSEKRQRGQYCFRHRRDSSAALSLVEENTRTGRVSLIGSFYLA